MKALVEWDPAKARSNRRKHDITFEEAATMFNDPFSATIPDPLHSDAEKRYVIIGRSLRQRILVVIHTDRGSRIRIISARIANVHERRTYEEAG